MRTGDTGREHAVSTRLEPRAEVDALFSAFHDQTTRALRLDRRRVELGTFCPAAEMATLQQTRSSDSHRGRVIGAMGAVGALGSLVGALLAAFLGQVIPVLALLVVQGSGYVIGGLVVIALTRGQRLSPVGEPTAG